MATSTIVAEQLLVSVAKADEVRQADEKHASEKQAKRQADLEFAKKFKEQHPGAQMRCEKNFTVRALREITDPGSYDTATMILLDMDTLSNCSSDSDDYEIATDSDEWK